MIHPVDRLEKDNLSIFLFHGVVEKNTYSVRNYTKKHVEKDTFAGIIRGLHASGKPLSMEEVVWHNQNSEPYPPRAFAVTFDDGFENNFSIAASILVEEGVPATFYVTTGFIESNAMSWIDRIEYCLENASSGGLILPWSEEIRPFQTPEDKIRLLEEIRQKAKNDPAISVASLVGDIFNQCCIEPVTQSNDQLDKKMSWKQVRKLNELPDFIVGGHSHTHAVMSFLSIEEVEDEISTSHELLKQKADISSRHYSYPEGSENSYSTQVIASLKRHGVVCCPTAIDGINGLSQDLFHLKRIMIT